MPPAADDSPHRSAGELSASASPGPAPGPAGNPLDEVLHPFVDDPLAFLERMHRDHGDVVRLRFFPEMYHLVSAPDEVRRILVTDANRYHAVAADLPAVGDGTGREGLGRRFHQLAREVFHADGGIAAMTPAIVASIARSLDRWEPAAARGEAVDLAAALTELTLGVVADVLLGGAEDLDLTRLGAAFDGAAMAGSVQHNVSLYQRAAGDVLRAERGFREAAAQIAGTVDHLIEARRARGAGADLLSRVVFDRDSDAPDRISSDHELRSSVGVLLVASHSAPASALTWTMHLLAHHPEVQDRLVAEIDAVLGPRPPVADDLSKLRYTRMVLLEAMRIYPPVWVLAPRLTTVADEIGGFAIPAGSKLLLSPWLLHRHPAIWHRPLLFDPDRFASADPRAYFPFGAGPWGCVGAQLGLVEARLAVAMMVQRFTWEPAPGHEVVPEPRLALGPRGGLPGRLIRREVTPM